MSPRTGRPPKTGQARNKSLNVRLKEDELAELEYCSKCLGISRTDVIVRGVRMVKEGLEKE